MSCLMPPAGDRVYNPGQSAAAPQDLPQRSVRPDAGLLAERAAYETQHQRDPRSAAQPGQGVTCIPGYIGLIPVGGWNAALVCVCRRVCMCVWCTWRRNGPAEATYKKAFRKKNPQSPLSFHPANFISFVCFCSLVPSSLAGDTFTNSNLTLEGFFSQRQKPSGVGLIEPD